MLTSIWQLFYKIIGGSPTKSSPNLKISLVNCEVQSLLTSLTHRALLLNINAGCSKWSCLKYIVCFCKFF